MSVLPLLYQIKKGKIIYIYIFNLLKSVLLLLILLCGRRMLATVSCLVSPLAYCWVLAIGFAV